MPDLDRTAYGAVRAFLDDTADAISYITRDKLSVTGHDPRLASHALTLARGDPVPLRGPHHLSFTVALWYSVDELPSHGHLWKVTTRAYAYALADADGHEILAYHWHPEARNAFTAPHLHLGSGSLLQRKELIGKHLPTGRVSIEDVVRCAITELDVQAERKNWDKILRATHARLLKSRTWE